MKLARTLPFRQASMSSIVMSVTGPMRLWPTMLIYNDKQSGHAINSYCRDLSTQIQLQNQIMFPWIFKIERWRDANFVVWWHRVLLWWKPQFWQCCRSWLSVLSEWLTDDWSHFGRRHDDVIKWKHFPRYWPVVRGIHRSPVNSPHKDHWRGALMFSLICIWINGWVNNHEAGDLRRYRAHYDVTEMETERSSGSQTWYSLGTMKLVFNESTEYHLAVTLMTFLFQ